MNLVDKLVCLLLVLCIAFQASSGRSPVCLDDDGSPLDWFAAIKVPKDHEHLPVKDYQYFLLTSKAKTWRLSKYAVNVKNGAIYNTANQAYTMGNDRSVVTLAYNDERPPSVSRGFGYSSWSGTGHMKGVLAFSAGGSGFWMIHSVPKFPGLSSYIYPDTGYRYGQHFLCVTFGFSELPIIARQLLLAAPTVFFHTLPDSIGSKIPDLRTLVNNKRPKFNFTTSLAKLQSSAGQIFLHFSKSPKFGKDLYDSFVAPQLKTSVFMEGWIDGSGDLPSSCNTPYHVYNIQKISLKGNNWSTSEDHSKWVVSADSSKPWVCLGDINRQASQSKRGGGTLCHSNLDLWKSFKAMVADYSHCPTANFGKILTTIFDIL